MSHERLTVRRRLRLGYTTLALAAGAGAGSAAFAQDSRLPGDEKSTEIRVEAEQRQTDQGFGGNTGISLAVPIGRVSIGPESLDGEPIYVRRLTVREGMTVVEVSTTPFVTVAHSAEAPRGVRPDQPASW